MPDPAPDAAQSSSRLAKKQKVAATSTASLLQGLMAKAKPIAKSSSTQGPGPVSQKSAEKDTAHTEQGSVPHLSEAIQAGEPMPRNDAGHVSPLWDAVKQGMQAFQDVINAYSNVDIAKIQKDNKELHDRMYSMDMQLRELLMAQEEQNRQHQAESSAHAEEHARLEQELAEFK